MLKDVSIRVIVKAFGGARAWLTTVTRQHHHELFAMAMAGEAHIGISPELKTLDVNRQTTTDSESFEEIDRIMQQKLIGVNGSTIPIDRISKWHAYVMKAVKLPRKEEIEKPFQKFINNEGEFYGVLQ
jgi:hypothetical protein